MKAYFKTLALRMESGDKKDLPNIRDLEDFHEFKWMLSVDEQAQLIKWVRKLSMEQVAPKEAAPSSSSAASSSKPKTKGTKADILKYFKPRK